MIALSTMVEGRKIDQLAGSKEIDLMRKSMSCSDKMSTKKCEKKTKKKKEKKCKKKSMQKKCKMTCGLCEDVEDKNWHKELFEACNADGKNPQCPELTLEEWLAPDCEKEATDLGMDKDVDFKCVFEAIDKNKNDEICLG